MIRSMTGFGKDTCKSRYGNITAEIKTLNHKSLGITCSPFSSLFLLEERVKDILEKKIFRGKVFVKISSDSSGRKKSPHKINIDKAAAADYIRKIKNMQKELGLKGDIQVRDIIAFPGVVETGFVSEDKIWPVIKKALQGALSELLKYREKEGTRLAKDFNKRLVIVRKRLQAVKKYEKQSVSNYRTKLTASIKEIALKPELDKGRLEAEVALFARNCDIAEEVTRLESNITAYKDALAGKETYVGKKLDFIAQEMQREVNTIGAKSNDYGISKAVIELKSEIEKMREQVKNIE